MVIAKVMLKLQLILWPSDCAQNSIGPKSFVFKMVDTVNLTGYGKHYASFYYRRRVISIVKLE